MPLFCAGCDVALPTCNPHTQLQHNVILRDAPERLLAVADQGAVEVEAAALQVRGLRIDDFLLNK